MNVEVMALRTFEHDETRRRGRTFRCSLHVARKLEERGLVVITDNTLSEADLQPAANPTPAAGAPSSASPADPASPEQTSSSSADGETPAEPDPEARTKKGGRKKGAA